MSVLAARRRLAQLLAERAFDAVVCHAVWPQVLFGGTARRAGLRQIFYMHDNARGRHWLEHWARRRPPDAVIANSHYTAGTAPLLFPRVPVHTTYCPVASQMPAGSAEVRHRVRAGLGTPEDTSVVVQACRMQSWKGHRLLLAALGELRERPSWEAWIIGGAQRAEEKAYEQELRTQAVELGIAARVRFLGQRADVPELLTAADLHCQPNATPEPFGIAFIEALYAGLPIVTTAMGAALEIVTPEVGRLVPPAEPGSLAAALGDFFEELSDPARCERLRQATTRRALTLCDPGARMRDLAVAFAGS